MSAISGLYSVTTAALDGQIRDGAHHMQVRIYFEDTDAGRIVYHANYLRFMERGRTNFLRLLGTDQGALLDGASDFAFVVRSMQIEFHKPAFLDDVLEIITAPEQVRGASLILNQRCRRGGDLVAEARVRVAFVSAGKAQRIPRTLRASLGGSL
jgi:acyl-CoA thioester hydrolase